MKYSRLYDFKQGIKYKAGKYNSFPLPYKDNEGVEY